MSRISRGSMKRVEGRPERSRRMPSAAESLWRRTTGQPAVSKGPSRYRQGRQTHDVSAEALCAEFHKPSPRRRSGNGIHQASQKRPVMPRGRLRAFGGRNGPSWGCHHTPGSYAVVQGAAADRRSVLGTGLDHGWPAGGVESTISQQCLALARLRWECRCGRCVRWGVRRPGALV